MTRRRVVVVAAAGLLAARSGAAQPARAMPLVAVLSHSIPWADMTGPQPRAPSVRALVEGLRALGHVEGRNLTIERRSAEGRPERIHEMVRDVIALKPEVIVTFGPVLLREVRQATGGIAIVAVAGGPALAAGDLARPGSNFTGLTTDANFSALNGKRLELLKEAAPGVSRVVAIRPPPQSGEPLWGTEVEQAARSLGMSLSIATAAGPDDFDAAFADIVRERPQGLLCVDTPANVANRQRIVQFAASERLPAVYGQRVFADVGGLISYGADVLDLSRQAAGYVDKILKGAKPGDLPIQQPTRFELVINQRAARAQGIALPRRLLLRADVVIDS